MLEQLRRNSRSFIIWILFAIIIAAFVFTFGSQSGLEVNCGASGRNIVMTVNDEPVTTHSLRFGLQLSREGSRSDLAARTQVVLNRLLEREILAQGAGEAGFSVTDDTIRERVAVTGELLFFGSPADGKAIYFEDYRGDKLFNDTRLKNFVNSYSLPSIEHFLAEQKREFLAYIMRQHLSSIGISAADEARARYDYDNTTAKMDAVKFRPLEYRKRLFLTDEQIAAYLAGHEDEVKKKYESDERQYKDRKPQVKVSKIVFKKARPNGVGGAKPEGAGGAEAADPALTAARQAHEKLTNGADFAELAMQVSEDIATKKKGGSVGWKLLKAPGLGNQKLADALAELEVGKFSDVIETPEGFHILKVEDKREGDLTYDQVKHEIAGKLAVTYYAKEGARRAAQAALAQAKSGKKLDEMFERKKATPPAQNPLGPGGLPQRPANMTDEQWEEFKKNWPEMLKKMQQEAPPALPSSPESAPEPPPPPGSSDESGEEQGAIMVESPDMPARSMWQGAGDKPPGDQPAPPEAAPRAAPAGAGAGTDAAGAGADDSIPVPEGLLAPTLESYGPFNRTADGFITGLGSSKELVDAIFDDLSAGDLAPEVYEIGDDFVIAQVVSREDPKPEDYDDKKKAEEMQYVAEGRARRAYQRWLMTRCRKLADDGKIGINTEALQDFSDSQDKPFPTFRPCSFGLRGF